MLIVADTTPLISLMKIERLDLLEKLFQRVVIPDAVYRELTSSVSFPEEARQIAKSEFIDRISVADARSIDLFRRSAGLDLGESEAIIYASAHHADILLMDEAKGRQIAKTMGLTVMGTIGILLESFGEGFLAAEDIESALAKLKANNRYISGKLIRCIREKIRSEAENPKILNVVNRRG